ncbi:MAG: DUF998 domain-containing protein, partial [Halanaeroarchaeum sp.]
MQSDRHRVLAGGTLIAMSTVTILGFLTAQSLFPGYSTASQTISALGSAEASGASKAVFNGTMIAAGVLTIIAAYALHHVYERWALTAVLGTTGAVGFVGVGVFPAQTGLPHLVAAVVAFAGAGVSALLTSATVRGPFGAVSAILGGFELMALVLF